MILHADLSRAYTWRPLAIPGETAERCRAIEARLLEVLTPWRKTVWSAGQAAVGVVTDCGRFLGAVYDTLEQKDRVRSLPRLSQDMPAHRPDLAEEALREFVRIYAPMIDVTAERTLEPGDLIVVGRGETGGPHHAIMVGPEPLTLWQTLRRVRKTPLTLLAGHQRVLYVYRPAEKRTWK